MNSIDVNPGVERIKFETCTFAGREISINWTRIEDLLKKHKNLNYYGWTRDSDSDISRINIRDHKQEIIVALAFISRFVRPIAVYSEPPEFMVCDSHFLRDSAEKWSHFKRRYMGHISNGIIILCMAYMNHIEQDYDYISEIANNLSTLPDPSMWFSIIILPWEKKIQKTLPVKDGGNSEKIDSKEKQPSHRIKEFLDITDKRIDSDEDEDELQIQSLAWSKLFPLGECRQYVEKKRAGIYEIYRKSEYGEYCVLYVGSSNNVRYRLHKHANLGGGNKELTIAIVKRDIKNFYARWAPTVDDEDVYQNTEGALIEQHGFGEGGLYIYNKTASTHMGRKRKQDAMDEDDTEEETVEEESNRSEASSSSSAPTKSTVRPQEEEDDDDKLVTTKQKKPKTKHHSFTQDDTEDDNIARRLKATQKVMEELCKSWISIETSRL